MSLRRKRPNKEGESVHHLQLNNWKWVSRGSVIYEYLRENNKTLQLIRTHKLYKVYRFFTTEEELVYLRLRFPPIQSYESIR